MNFYSRKSKVFKRLAINVIILTSLNVGLQVSAPTPSAHAAEKPINITSTTKPSRSVQKIVNLALKNSELIKVSEAEYAAARADTAEIKKNIYPKLNLKSTVTNQDYSLNYTSAVTTSNRSNNKDYSAYAEGILPLYVGGAITDGVESKYKSEEIKKYNLEYTRQNLLLDVLKAYYQIVTQVKLLKAANEYIVILNKYFKTVSRYEKIGRSRKVDLLISKINLSRTETDRSDLENQLKVLKENLKHLLSVETLNDIEFDDSNKLETLSKWKYSTEASLQKCYEQNLEIKMAQLSLAQIQNDKSIDLASDLPNLQLRGQYGYRARAQTDWVSADSTFSLVSLELSIPFFSGFSSFDKRRRYNEKSNGYNHKISDLKSRLQSELNSKIGEYKLNEEHLATAQKTVGEAQEALALANRDWDRNLISNQDLISIQKTHYDTTQYFIHSEYQYIVSRFELSRIIGDDLLQTINLEN